MDTTIENESSTTTLGTRLEVLRRRWRYPALIIPSCVLLAVFVAFVVTPLYRSSGTIMLEPSSVPAKFVDIATTYADQQFELIQRRVMTAPNLVALVKKVDPYPEIKDATVADKAAMIAANTTIERVDPVTLETLQQSNAFSIHYDNPDPAMAKRIADELVKLFLEYNYRTRRERAAATYAFLKDEATKLSTSIQGMERRLAQFKSKYGDALPQAESRNLASLDNARRNYDAASAQMRLADEQVNQLQLQLNDLNPTLVGAISDPRNELAQLKADLAEAQKKYTPDHPDVKRLKRAVQDLVAQQRAGGGGGGTAKPDNPDYLRVQSQLEAAKRNLQAQRAAVARAGADIQSYTKALEMTPSVEREYSQLSREYTLAQEHFREIQGKLTEADLGRAMVDSEQGERFTLIRNPNTPSSPHSPNRLGVILLGVVLGGALGFGGATLAEISDPAVRSARDLLELTGHTMIAAVPRLLNDADRHARRRRWAYAGLGFGTACAAVVVAVIANG
jgi:polysaccharide chain length determinant protein (PEP-CTERM system associated)